MLSSDVYHVLLDKLLRGELKPGDAINRRQVAAECDVSVAPVSEAMQQLEHEGFFRTIPRKGTFVRYYSQEEIMGHLILKAAIECAAAERCDPSAVQEHYDELYAQALALDQWNGAKLMEKWRMDLDFHRALVALAGYTALTEEFERIAVPNLFYHVHQFLFSNGNQSHVKLLRDLMQPDRQEAIRCLKEHLWSGKKL